MKYKCIIQSVWIITAWQRISPEVTVKDFKECCMSSEMDKTDDDMLWNGSDVEGTVSSECEEDEGTDCENGDSDTDW
jgi:hypothetical protein